LFRWQRSAWAENFADFIAFIYLLSFIYFLLFIIHQYLFIYYYPAFAFLDHTDEVTTLIFKGF